MRFKVLGEPFLKFPKNVSCHCEQVDGVYTEHIRLVQCRLREAISHLQIGRCIEAGPVTSTSSVRSLSQVEACAELSRSGLALFFLGAQQAASLRLTLFFAVLEELPIRQNRDGGCPCPGRLIVLQLLNDITLGIFP